MTPTSLKQKAIDHMSFKTLICAVVLTALSTSASVAQQPGVPGAQFLTTWDLDADGTATLAELEEMRGMVFVMFDADEDAILTAEEYSAFDEARANDMANHQGGEQGRGVMQRVADGLALAPNDADGDGAVTLAEFIGGTQAWMAGIDRDGDGAITSADFGR